MLLIYIYIYLALFLSMGQWFSGKIGPCHGPAPGSIPGCLTPIYIHHMYKDIYFAFFYVFDIYASNKQFP